MNGTDKLTQIAIAVGVVTLVFALIGVLTGTMADIAQEKTSYSNELHAGTDVGALPSNITLDNTDYDIDSVSKVAWENNGQAYVNEKHATPGALPTNISLTNTNDGLGFVDGEEVVIWEDVSGSTNTTLSTSNYTTYPGDSKIELNTINDYNETEDNIYVNYTTASSNTTLTETTDYELVDSGAGTLEIKDSAALSDYANSDDNFYVSYGAYEDTTASEISRKGAEAQLKGANFIPIILLIGVIVFVLTLVMRLRGQ